MGEYLSGSVLGDSLSSIFIGSTGSEEPTVRGKGPSSSDSSFLKWSLWSEGGGEEECVDNTGLLRFSGMSCCESGRGPKSGRGRTGLTRAWCGGEMTISCWGRNSGSEVGGKGGLLGNW